MGNRSSTSKRRKHQLLEDFTDFNVDVLTTLKADDGTLVEKTTDFHYGGENKLYKTRIDKDLTIVSVSGPQKKSIKQNNSVDIPVYTHYVLTESGFRWIQKQLITGRLRHS